MTLVRTGSPCSICHQPIVDGDCSCTMRRARFKVSFELIAQALLAGNIIDVTVKKGLPRGTRITAVYQIDPLTCEVAVQGPGFPPPGPGGTVPEIEVIIEKWEGLR